MFWNLDLVLTPEDEQAVSLTTRDQPLLKKRRRSAYLNTFSEDGTIFTIQVLGGRVVAVGNSVDEVWDEFKSMFIGSSDYNLPSHLTGEWFFGISSDYMQQHQRDMIMRSVKKQAGVHRDQWLYNPQVRDYVIEMLGLKSDLKPVVSVRRNLASRIEGYKNQIDQLNSLGRHHIESSVASDILEPAMVLPEWSNPDDLSSKPVRITRTQENPTTGDNASRYKVRSGIADKDLLAVKRSKIHNYGLFARNGFAKGEMVVEYQGEVLRQTVADEREKRRERQGGGDGGSCYLFALDNEYVVDATVKGNCARFINHSCSPNCICKVIEDDSRQKHLMIIAKRDIAPEEEITYDYQFAVESEKLACLCGAPNCLGRLN